MKKYVVLIVMMFVVCFSAKADVQTDFDLDFNWTISDGLNPVPYYGTYWMQHDYLYDDDYANEQVISVTGQLSSPDAEELDTSSGGGSNTMSTNVAINSYVFGSGVVVAGALNSSSFATLEAGQQESLSMNSADISNIDIDLPSFSASPNWVMSLTANPLLTAVMDGAHPDQRSRGQFYISAMLRLMDSGMTQAQNFYFDETGFNLLANEYYGLDNQNGTDGETDPLSFDLHLNPYDPEFVFDISGLSFTPEYGTLQLGFNTYSAAYEYEPNPQDPGNGGDDPVVPEPATLFLLGSGLLGLLGFKKRK